MQGIVPVIYFYFIYSYLTFLNISRSPPNCGLLFLSGYSIHLMALSQNTSGSTDPDSLNQYPITGHHTTTTTTSSTTTTTTSSTTSTTSRVFPTITSPSCIARDTSGNKVNVMRTFQEMFENAKIAFDRINFYSNLLIDRAQIEQFENMYRELDFYIDSLLPYFGPDLDIRGIIYDMRNLQNKIEDRLINFYQNLSERDQIKVVFSLPQLQNRSFVQAVNRSVNHLGDLSVSQSVIQSVSHNISLVQNSPPKQDSSFLANSSREKFSPSKTSTPKKAKNFEINKSRENFSPSKTSTKIKAKFDIFLRRKIELEVEVEELLSSSKDEQVQPSTLKLRALDLKSRLTSLGIESWINDDKICHLDPKELSSWEDKISKNIANVLYQAEDKITIRKGLAQSGLKRRDPPCFNGSVLDFPLFKKNWAIEVTPGGLPELIELNYLKSAVPSSAKDRLYEIETLKEAWSILEQIYGKEFDLRNRLKQEFLAIEISAKSSPSIEIEIYQKVHKVASRIRAAKAQNLLESDFEYISLVYQLLPENQKEKWVTVASPNPTWDSFYSFLGEVYEKALLKKQINDSCKQNSGRGTDYNKQGSCIDCNINENNNDNFCATLVKQECCPICNDGLHTFEMPSMGGNKVITGRRLLNCDQFYYAGERQKQELFLKVKAQCKNLCKYCTSWQHSSSECTVRGTCKSCNFEHARGACSLQSL